MNILIFSWRGIGHPNAGGAEIVTHEHARAWVKAGHKVTLFTSWFRGCNRDQSIDGVRILRRGYGPIIVHVKAFYWYLFSTSEKFDVVVDQFHGIPFFTPLFVRTKKLAFIHEVAKEVWWLNPWPRPFNLIPAILGSFLEPLIFKIFYRNIAFMTVSRSTKSDLVSWNIPENNITIIHNGVKKFSTTSHYEKERKKTVLFLGALTKDKGAEEALKVFRCIDVMDEDYQFWIAGKGDRHYQGLLVRRSREMGISDKLTFWGFVSEKRKFELFSKAHILIDTSVREGWGLVVIEAASAGTPTVGYNVPGLRDSIVHGKTGYLCEPVPLACAMKIVSLLESRTDYTRIRRNCFKWARKFNWRKSTKKSLSYIHTLICKY